MPPPPAKHKDDALMNHLLAALPADQFASLKPYLEPVSLALGEVIYESGEQLEYIFFFYHGDYFAPLHNGKCFNG